jgi:hypothetical protein
MATIHEYDLKFEPTCIVCGKGFCKMASKSQDSMAREEEGWENKLLVYTNKILCIPTNTYSWYIDITYFLHHGTCPSHMNSKEKNDLCLNSTQCKLINGILLQRNYDGVLLRCLEKNDAEKVLKDLHDGLV